MTLVAIHHDVRVTCGDVRTQPRRSPCIVQEVDGPSSSARHFDHGHLSFTGQDAPMANLMLCVMGAYAEFEWALIRERQLEGIELAKWRSVCGGCRISLSNNGVPK